MTARLILACLLLAPGLASAQSTQEIFRIERSRSKKLVRYDARIGKDGKLDPKEPMVAYWVDPDGKTRPLAVVDRTFFYGFRARKDKHGDFWHLTLVAAKDRPMKLYLKDGQPRAEGRIGGVTAFLQKLFVRFAENTTIPKVLWVDLIGVDAKTGEPRRERGVP